MPKNSKEKPSTKYPWQSEKSPSEPGTLTVKRMGIDAPNEKEYRRLEAEFIRLGFTDDMRRSLEQNDCFHPWVRECMKRWNQFADEGREGFDIKVTEESMKEMILLAFGNVKVIPMPGIGENVIAMRSHKFAATPADLTEAERKAGYKSMQELLGELEAWAARVLELQLVRDAA